MISECVTGQEIRADKEFHYQHRQVNVKKQRKGLV